jgi:uncharacterized protein (DUF934 family)
MVCSSSGGLFQRARFANGLHMQAAFLGALLFPPPAAGAEIFTDGRAFSQAFLLRRRLGFKGDICATGDVLIDQLTQMQRSGFSQAVLREDQDLDHGRKLLAHYPAFYQGDAVDTQPHFAVAA